MFLTAKIRNGFVREAYKYDKFNNIKWKYFFNYPSRIEIILIKDNMTSTRWFYSYNCSAKEKVLYRKLHYSGPIRIDERYYNNGFLSERMTTYKGSLHSHNSKPSLQRWYENGMRKNEFYHTRGKLNNPIGPSVTKWNSNGYLLRCKYYSHGYRINYKHLADRIENHFKKE